MGFPAASRLRATFRGARMNHTTDAFGAPNQSRVGRGRDWPVPLIGLCLSAAVLAYFLLLDRAVFFTRGFSPIFDVLLAVLDAHAVWLGTLIAFLAFSWRRAEPVRTLAGLVGRHPVLVAAVAVVALAFGSVSVYHDYPLAMDEYAAVFQAKIFASGHLVGYLPPYLVKWLITPGFNGVFLFASPITGRVVEAYWPGFALLLAPFERLGVPWLCNPLLAGVGLYFIHRITLEITLDRVAAGFAVLFSAASGAYVANAISFYSMQAHLTANLLYAWLLMAPSRRRALGAGFVGSLALILHNPFPHMLFALPWGIASLVDRDRRRFLVPLIAGYLPLSVVGGIGWFRLRGQIGADLHRAGGSLVAAFRLPDAVMWNARVAGFAKLWVWAVPCLLVFAVLGLMRWRSDRHVRLLAWSALVTFFGYFFVVFDQGHGWGNRYFHSAWGVLPILAACAFAGERAADERLTAFAGAATVLSLVLLVPYQLYQIDGFIGRHLAQIPAPKRPGNDVFFVNPAGGFYIGDMIQNDPELRDPDLRMFSYGPRRDAALVHRFWPHAVEVDWGPFGEEWNLGPVDRRVRPPGASSPRFVFPPAPPANSVRPAGGVTPPR